MGYSNSANVIEYWTGVMLVHVSFSTPFNNQQQSWFMAVCQSYSIIIGFAFPSEQSAAPATSKGPSVECRAIGQCLIHHGLQYPIILPRDGRFPQQEVLIDISTAGISSPIVRWFIPSSTQNSAKYEVGFTDVYCTYFFWLTTRMAFHSLHCSFTTWLIHRQTCCGEPGNVESS